MKLLLLSLAQRPSTPLVGATFCFRFHIKNYLLAVVAILVLAGCKNPFSQSEKKPVHVTTTSTTDAGKTYVDKEYQFQITWPGDNWKVLDQAEAARLAPDALSGLINTKNKTFAVVIVEKMPDVKLKKYFDIITSAMTLEDKQITAVEEKNFQKYPTISFTITGKISSVPFTYQGLIINRNGIMYQLLAWSPGVKTPDSQTVQKSFSILPGTVVGRNAATKPVPDSSGAGWRVKNGIYESALTGIRISPLPGYRVIVSGELAEMNEDAEVGLLRGNPDVYLTVISEPAPKKVAKALKDAAQRTFFENLEVKGKPQIVQLTSMGKKRDFYVAQGNLPMEFLYGTIVQNGYLYQIISWYSTGLKTIARPEAKKAVSAVQQVSTKQQKLLANELLTAPDGQHGVGLDFSLRQGAYRNYQHNIVLRKPHGFWNYRTGDAARRVDENATVYIESPQLGVTGTLYVEEGDWSSAEEYHAALIAEIKQTIGFRPQKTISVPLANNKTGHLTWGDTKTEALTLDYAIISTLYQGCGIEIILSRAHNSTDFVAICKQIAQSLSTGDAGMAIQETNGRYINHRLGFSVKSPYGKPAKSETPKQIKPVGEVVSWKKGISSVAILAIDVLQAGADEDWFLALIEQATRDRIEEGKGTNEPIETQTVVAGVPARVSTHSQLFKKTVTTMFSNNGVIYGIIWMGNDLKELQQIRNSFKFEK